MRQFVHKDEGRAAGESGVEVELLQGCAAILDLPAGQGRQRPTQCGSSQQCFGFHPAMRFDIADEDIDTLSALFEAGLKHGIGFAHTSCCAEEDFELATSLLDL